MQPLRTRTATYVIAVLLAAFTLYTLTSLSQPTRVEATTDPWNEGRPDPGKVPHGEHAVEESKHQDGLPPVAPSLTPPTKETAKPESTSTPPHQEGTATYKPPTGESIDDLIKDAEQKFKNFEHERTFTMSDAAEAYRKRRGMHPPPGWNLWFEYARDNDAIIIEEFWDQIYHDLNPFWGIEPAMLRAQARKFDMVITIKNGTVADRPDWFWHKIWARMIETFVDKLPDMLIALNPLDESRLLVEREQMDKYMAKSIKTRKLVDPKHVVSDIAGWHAEEEPKAPETPDPEWNGFNVYRFVRKACGKDSPARQFPGVLSAQRIMAEHEHSDSKLNLKQYFDGKFVVNNTEATDICSDATIGGLHGALMLPFTVRVSNKLQPIFGGSKFHVNNEILVPAPMYWDGEGRFGGEERDVDTTPWSSKKDQVIWRGTATGGRSKPYTWFLYHRHRFVALTNGTKYSQASEKNDLIFTPLFRESAISHLKQPTRAHLGDWLKDHHDVAFTDLVCDEDEHDKTCWYLDSEFNKAKPMNFNKHWSSKYLPDIDGNSFSGRFRAFLLSNSLPIKATIYREWHDSRLIPWYHFVPMNNRFSDYYAILEYFIGSKDIPGHDEAAEKIATAGKKWGERVLRKVDMQVYMLRLLLEYARVMDENRANLGWIEDILANSSTAHN